MSGIATLLTGAPAVAAALARVALQDILLLLGLASVAFALRVLRWMVYARAIGISAPALDHTTIYLGGFALGATPGRVGEVVRLYLLRTGFGYPFRRSAPLLVADRLNDVNTLALLMLLGIGYVAQQWLLVGIALALVIALNVALRWPALLLRCVDAGYLATGKRLRRPAAAARRLLRRIASTFTPSTQLLASGLSLLAWGAECTSLFVVLERLGEAIDLRAAFAVHATASLVGALSMLPGGIGGFEATALALLVWQGISTPAAVVATAILRVTTFWYSLALGVPMLWWAFARMRKRSAL